MSDQKATFLYSSLASKGGLNYEAKVPFAGSSLTDDYLIQ